MRLTSPTTVYSLSIDLLDISSPNIPASRLDHCPLDRSHSLEAARRKPKPPAVPHRASTDERLHDPTRELYQEFNKAFADDWKQKTGQTVAFEQPHIGSGKQARSVIDGLKADAHAIKPGWETRLPNNATPYTSTIVFLVRKGNLRAFTIGRMLSRKASASSRRIPRPPAALAGTIWPLGVYAWNHSGHDEKKARDFIAALYKNVPVSILDEPPVAVVDKYVDAHGTRAVAEAYLKYLYTDAGQEIATKNFYRPRNANVLAKYKSQFPDIQLFTITDIAGRWKEVQPKYSSSEVR
jgi:ABC-type sulfate transport system substrate-binding protein